MLLWCSIAILLYEFIITVSHKKADAQLDYYLYIVINILFCWYRNVVFQFRPEASWVNCWLLRRQLQPPKAAKRGQEKEFLIGCQGTMICKIWSSSFREKVWLFIRFGMPAVCRRKLREKKNNSIGYGTCLYMFGVDGSPWWRTDWSALQTFLSFTFIVADNELGLCPVSKAVLYLSAATLLNIK